MFEEVATAIRPENAPELTEAGDGIRDRTEQRVAIARALANDPAAVLADEPTANLDGHIGHEVMRLMRRIAREQGRSVIIVSHDERIKDIADRVLWLEDGMFNSLTERAVDPVCGMSVDQDQAVRADYQGVTYYFCARGCRDEFLEEPERFTHPREGVTT